MGYYPNLLHILSYVFIFGDFIILAGSWRVLYEAQKTGTIAITGQYKYHQASPISRAYYYNAMLPAPMADFYNVINVSDTGVDVRSSRTQGRR